MNLSEEDKDMIVNEISLVIQNIISFLENQVTVDQKKHWQEGKSRFLIQQS